MFKSSTDSFHPSIKVIDSIDLYACIFNIVQHYLIIRLLQSRLHYLSLQGIISNTQYVINFYISGIPIKNHAK